MSECPCKHCDKRNPECHGNCKDYLEWFSEKQSQNREMFEKNRIKIMLDEESVKKSIRNKRKRGKIS